MNVLRKLEDMAKFYESELKKYSKILPTLPKKNLYIYRKRKSFFYKYKNEDDEHDTNEHNIPFGEELLAATLALRKVLEQRKICYEARLKHINKYLNDIKKEPREFIRDKYVSEFYRLIKKYYPEFSNDWQEKLNKKYECLKPDPTSHDISTTAGIMVRSKSEAIIVDMLYSLGIPFVYEPKVVLSNGKVVYPDFIIADPITGAEYMWEHLGKLEKQDYAARSYSKIIGLNELGWYLGINFIVTTETLDNKLRIWAQETPLNNLFQWRRDDRDWVLD